MLFLDKFLHEKFQNTIISTKENATNICILCFSEVLTTPKDGEILIDYSKNRINDEVFNLLINLVRYFVATMLHEMILS